MSKRRGVTILGSTGSIGVSTLDVIALHADRFDVVALSAHSQLDRLFDQCRTFRPRYAVVSSPADATALGGKIRAAGLKTEVLGGDAALEGIASLPEADCVMAAIVGAAGLKPTLAAVRAGKRVLLANKESLVMSGSLFMQDVAKYGATLLPIDSEHNAIFQALPANHAGSLASAGVTRIVLTASGGPFRTRPVEELERVTPDEACAHPNWAMGRKISVDSATMMNKGLEVIEAHWLFDAAPEIIEVVLHPQSVIHSMVGYADGSIIAQMGNPDMRTPIAYGLGYPERIAAGVAALDLVRIGRLDFEPLDHVRFPCVGLAYGALRAGGSAPAAFNAANEIVVAAFLAGEARFTDIPRVIGETLERVETCAVTSLDDVLHADAEARRAARSILTKTAGRV